jgi:hypothetical protein
VTTNPIVLSESVSWETKKTRMIVGWRRISASAINTPDRKANSTFLGAPRRDNLNDVTAEMLPRGDA